MPFFEEQHIQHQPDNHLDIIKWLADDPFRMEALKIASTLSLPDWCIAAGFVRNLVWDHLHGFEEPTKLIDIDLIYYNPDNVDPDKDDFYERQLKKVSDLPWSVKNQARMHIRNEDEPYSSTSDAMSYWVEIEAAIGATLGDDGGVDIVAPFGVVTLFDKCITINEKRMKPKEFHARISNKNWLKVWPHLKVHGPTYFGS